ncbi:hypothetical protein D9M71_79690 [compost metagenome]
MNSEEQTLIDGLFARLKQAEAESAPRDAQAQARIMEQMAAHPSAPYYMAQAILVQEAALKQLDEQNKQLQKDLDQARAQVAATTPNNGGFLSSIFGSGTRAPQAAPAQAPAPAASGGGWREPSRAFGNPAGVAPQGYAPLPPAAAPARAASSFLGGALQTAAGVAGGVMLAQGISSLFNHNSQPQEVVEVIKEEPSPASDSGWGNEQQQLVGNDTYSDQSGFMDTDYSDDGGFFSDDDSFV